MENLDIDKALDVVKGWGKFQILIFVPLCCAAIFSTFQMNYVVVARDIKYRCRIPSCNEDFGEYNPEWLKNAVPYENDIPSRCLRYKPQDNNTCTDFNKNETMVCSDYVFEINQTTIVQDFDITCDENLWKLTIVGTICAIGELCGLPFIGHFSDRFGRKRMLMVSLFLSTITGLVKSFSTSYYVYLVLEFLDTSLGCDIYGGSFILAVEMVDTKKRGLANSIICIASVIGQVIYGLVAWLSPTWRLFLRFTYGSGIVIVSLLWFVPESIHWQLANNKVDEVMATLNRASKLNTGSELERDTFRTLKVDNTADKENEESVTYANLLKSKTLVVRTIISTYIWVCCAFSYHGLIIQSVALSEDVYMDYIYGALIEIPAYLATQAAIDRIGRKKTLISALMLASISCFFVTLNHKPSWLTLSIFLCGKFFISVSYSTVAIYTVEMFPTKLRASIYALCMMAGNLGTMSAPQVPLLQKLFKPLPYLIFAGMAISSGLLAFLFPETLNCKLPDEIDEAINLKNTERL